MSTLTHLDRLVVLEEITREIPCRSPDAAFSAAS
jgi:hypothetical protein